MSTKWQMSRISRFFFSSRRRHTRYWRDWSSDVCSSDLPAALRRHARARVHHEGRLLVPRRRSEERRVGKECRSRGAAQHRKKKVIDTRVKCQQDNIYQEQKETHIYDSAAQA